MPQIHSFTGEAAPELLRAAGDPSPDAPGAASAGIGRRLLRQWPLISATLLACMIAATVYLVTAQRWYVSTAQLTIQPLYARPVGGSAGAPAAPDPMSLPQMGVFLATQRERILSRSILALTLARQDIKKLQTFNSSEPPLKRLKDHLSVDIVKSNQLVDVTFEAPVAEDAPLIANAVVESFIQYQNRPRDPNNGDALASYQSQIEKDEADLNERTAKMQAMEAQYGVLSGAADGTSIPLRRLNSISQELTAAQLDVLKTRSELDEASRIAGVPLDLNPATSQPATAAAGVSSVQQESQIRTDLAEAETHYQELRHHYLAGHPILQSLQEHIDDLKQSYGRAIQRRWNQTRERERVLQQAFDEQQKLAVEISAKTADYSRMASDVSRLRQHLDALQSRVQTLELARSAGAVDTEFLEPAAAFTQSRPRVLPTMLGSILIGLTLGSMLGLTRQRLDDRLRTVEDAKGATGLRLLGVVPTMPSTMSATVVAQKAALDPASEVADAYRTIRTALNFSVAKDRSKTILITSASDGDGKTVTASNLAIALAQSGKRVLLVDGNLRKPMQHVNFGIRQNLGLATALAGQGTVERATQTTSIEGLSVLPCGPMPRNPAEMLNSPAFPEMLDHLADKFDHIVIDSPAVLGNADARIMAASCDVTIMVFKAGVSTRRTSVAARDGLTSVGAHILGAIVTHVGTRDNAMKMAPVPEPTKRGGLTKRREKSGV